MATRQQLYSPVNAFIQGRAARQDYDYGQTRNKLADLELQDAPQQMQRRNALADTQLQGAQLQVEGAQTSLDKEKAGIAYAGLKQALDSGNPRAFITQQIPDLAKALQLKGIDLASMDDQSVTQLTDQLARKYASEAGIAPTEGIKTQSIGGSTVLTQGGKYVGNIAPQKPDGFALGPGQTRFDATGKPIASVAPTPAKPTNTFRALTPQEVAAAGLPAGTSAQRDEATGKIDVLSKRDNTGTLSQKDTVTAKQKLTTIRVARKQLADIKKAFDEGRKVVGPNSFGPGQGMLPTERGKKFDAAVDRMRSTLTALTRVPGVGAMSDYETKLDQGKFPKRNTYESVTAEQIQGIEDLLSTIESGYAGLLSGEAPAEAPAAQTGEVRVNSPQEAMALPPGTVFITPDGRRKVR